LLSLAEMRRVQETVSAVAEQQMSLAA